MCIACVQARYEAHHPKLIAARPHAYSDGTLVLDVFAYYRGEQESSEADPGTLLRSIERLPAGAPRGPVEGGEVDGGGGGGNVNYEVASEVGAEGAARPLPLPGLVAVAAEFAGPAPPAYYAHRVSHRATHTTLSAFSAQCSGRW